MAEFFVGLWRALTAAGRSLALGTVEAWGFWSSTLLLLCVVFFLVHLAGGIFWRMIEARLKPHPMSRELELRYREEIRRLKAELYDIERANVALTEKSTNLERVIEAQRSWQRNWNADARAAARGA